jgi:hypothetical protein
LSSALRCVGWLLLVASACLGTESQAAAQVAAQVQLPNATQTTPVEQVPRVPGVSALFRGFNAGVTFSQVHDSSAGWYNVLTPAVSFAISTHYSVDASASIYPYRRIENPNPATQSEHPLVTDLFEAGDTFVGLHASFRPGPFRNTGTASFSIPTGDRADGLGTGRVTFDFSDRLERDIKQTGLLLDVGGGDSSGLFNRLISREESSLGPLAHFQAGVALYLPWSIRAQSVAYEQLPLGHQTVYETVSPPGAPSSTVISGTGVSEDNGFTTSLAIPLTDNLILSSYYNRSLRQHLDTVSMGVTYVLRGTPRRRRLSMIDKALREAEGLNH